MAKTTFEIKVTFNRFPEIAAAMPERTSKVVRKVAFDIQDGAQQRAPVDTSALKNSIYVKSSDGASGYASARMKALQVNPKVDFLPEMQTPEPISAVVGPSVEYGAPVEFGRSRGITAGGFSIHGVGAQPYLIPAAETQRPKFIAAMKQMLGDL